MKTVHIIRHAKSSWEYPHLADIDRPLNERGISACQIMANAILESPCAFSNVYTSPAVRAQSTIGLIAQALQPKDIHWLTDDALYCFDYFSIMQWLSDLPEDFEEVVIVGHNPALTDLVNNLSGEQLENIPTCGYVQLTSEGCLTWADIQDNTFIMQVFLTPKKLKKRLPY